MAFAQFPALPSHLTTLESQESKKNSGSSLLKDLRTAAVVILAISAISLLIAYLLTPTGSTMFQHSASASAPMPSSPLTLASTAIHP